ncbi:hypothetical protein PZA11_005509 [Diplocarpon coronariae]
MPPRTVPLHYRVLCGDPNGESTRDFIFYERIPTRLTNKTDDPQTPKSNNILKTFLSQLENLHAEEMFRSQPWQCAFCSGPAVKFDFSGVARLGSAIPTVSVIGVPCCFYEACLQKVGTISGPYLSRLSGVVSPETLLKSLTPCEKCGPVAHATLCRDCKSVGYCCEARQKHDWIRHEPECRQIRDGEEETPSTDDKS